MQRENVKDENVKAVDIEDVEDVKDVKDENLEDVEIDIKLGRIDPFFISLRLGNLGDGDYMGSASYKYLDAKEKRRFEQLVVSAISKFGTFGEAYDAFGRYIVDFSLHDIDGFRAKYDGLRKKKKKKKK